MSAAQEKTTKKSNPTNDATARAVFSNERTVHAPKLALPESLRPNTRLKMDGLEFLSLLPESAIPVAFLDPQYRGVLDKLAYGNEGKSRETRRGAMTQMSDALIGELVRGIDRVLIPSGHLFLWVDKFHLCQGVRPWLEGTAARGTLSLILQPDRFPCLKQHCNMAAISWAAT